MQTYTVQQVLVHVPLQELQVGGGENRNPIQFKLKRRKAVQAVQVHRRITVYDSVGIEMIFDIHNTQYAYICHA